MKKSPSAVIISVFMIICFLVNAWQIPVSLTADAITELSGTETADSVNGESRSNTVYALVMISAVTLGFAAASSRKRKIKK